MYFEVLCVDFMRFLCLMLRLKYSFNKEYYVFIFVLIAFIDFFKKTSIINVGVTHFIVFFCHILVQFATQ